MVGKNDGGILVLKRTEAEDLLPEGLSAKKEKCPSVATAVLQG